MVGRVVFGGPRLGAGVFGSFYLTTYRIVISSCCGEVAVL
jgi:hypothetical protein